MKAMIEVEYERLGDFFQVSDKVIEGLVNILDPDMRAADSWEITFVRPLNGRGTITFSRVSNKTGDKNE